MADSLSLLSKKDTIIAYGKNVLVPRKTKDTLIVITIPNEKKQVKFWDKSEVKLWAPFIFTVFVFLLGQILTVYLKKREKRNSLTASKTSLETWCSLLKASVSKFKDNCILFQEQLLAEQAVQRVTFRKVSTLVDKLSEYKVSELLDFTSYNLKGANSENSINAYSIAKSIEHLKLIESEVIVQYNLFIENADELIENWNKSKRELDDLIMKMYNEVASKQNHTSYEFSKQIEQHEVSFHNMNLDKSLVSTWEQQYLPNLFKLIDKEFRSNPSNSFAAQFAIKAGVLQVVLKRWNAVKTSYARLIGDYGTAYYDSYQILENSIEKLRTTKVKCSWSIR